VARAGSAPIPDDAPVISTVASLLGEGRLIVAPR
jgi:hypothetical protein